MDDATAWYGSRAQGVRELGITAPNSSFEHAARV